MPVMVYVGAVAYPVEPYQDSPPDDSVDQPPVRAQFWIPHLWQLTPLERVSVHLALGRPLPKPWQNDPTPPTGTSTYIDQIDEGASPIFRSVLAEDTEGIIAPDGFDSRDLGLELSETHPQHWSLHNLKIELAHIEEALFEGQPVPGLAQAMDDLAKDPENRAYSIEKQTLVALKTACELAQNARTPLILKFVPSQKPLMQEFSIYDLHIWGLDRFEATHVTGNGRGLRVIFPGGYRYLVPTEYIREWSDCPPSSSQIIGADIHQPDALDLSVTFADGCELLIHCSAFLARCEVTFEDFHDHSDERARQWKSWLETADRFREHPT